MTFLYSMKLYLRFYFHVIQIRDWEKKRDGERELGGNEERDEKREKDRDVYILLVE